MFAGFIWLRIGIRTFRFQKFWERFKELSNCRLLKKDWASWISNQLFL
jgi:hypothetical protein